MAWYVVDGMDGSGKSTAAAMIAERLESRGRRVRVMTHPSRDTLIGRAELALLRREGRAAMMLSVAFYVLDVLRSLILTGGRRCRGCDDVVFVRYIMSVAYLPDGLCGRAYRVISKVLPMPDAAVLVDVDPGTAMERIRGRGEDLEVFETEERLAAVRGRMLALSEGWIVLGNDDGPEDLREQVDSLVFGDAP